MVLTLGKYVHLGIIDSMFMQYLLKLNTIINRAVIITFTQFFLNSEIRKSAPEAEKSIIGPIIKIPLGALGFMDEAARAVETMPARKQSTPEPPIFFVELRQ